MAPPCQPRRCSLMPRSCVPSSAPPCHTQRCYHPRNNHIGPFPHPPCKARHRRCSPYTAPEPSCSALDQSGSSDDTIEGQECNRNGKCCTCATSKPKNTCPTKKKKPCPNKNKSTTTDNICPAAQNKLCEAAPATSDEGTITTKSEVPDDACSCKLDFIEKILATRSRHTCPPPAACPVPSACPPAPCYPPPAPCHPPPAPCRPPCPPPPTCTPPPPYPPPCAAKPKPIQTCPKVDEGCKQCDVGDQKAKQKAPCTCKHDKVHCECAKEMKRRMKKKKSKCSVVEIQIHNDKCKWKSDCGVQQAAECPVCANNKDKSAEMSGYSERTPGGLSCNQMQENDSNCSCDGGLSTDDDVCTKLGCEFVSEIELANVVEPVCNMVKPCSSDGVESTNTDGAMECNCRYPPAFGPLPCTGALSDTCQCKPDSVDE